MSVIVVIILILFVLAAGLGAVAYMTYRGKLRCAQSESNADGDKTLTHDWILGKLSGFDQSPVGARPLIPRTPRRSADHETGLASGCADDSGDENRAALSCERDADLPNGSCRRRMRGE